MSHYSVLVLGENPEELLAPYDENIQVEPYDDEELDPQKAHDWAQSVIDDPDKIRETWRERGEADAIVAQKLVEYRRIAALDLSDPTDVEELLTWYGHAPDRRRQRPDGSWVALSRYNPMSKWDYYRLGGRWRGSLKIKDDALVGAAQRGDTVLGELGYEFNPEYNRGQRHVDDVGWVDQCRRGDLDLAGMAQKKVEAGELAITRLMDWIAQHGMPPSTEWMDAVDRKEITGDAIKDAREEYWRGPWMKEFNKAYWDARDKSDEERIGLGVDGWWDIEDFRLVTENPDGRDRFLHLQRARGIPGYALLDEEHGWMAPGDMGWFGMSSDSLKSRIGFYEARLAIVENLPDDVLMGVYDCHI